MKSIFHANDHRAWGALPLVALLWHAAYTWIQFSPQHLLFLCYPANAMLGLGVLFAYPWLAGISAFWVISALPLYLHNAISFSDYAVSGVVFHVVAAFVGVLVVCTIRLPRRTWLAALGFGAAMQLAARFLTRPEYNINAAFSVYKGYGTFSEYLVYLAISYLGFASAFGFLQFCNARFIRKEDGCC